MRDGNGFAGCREGFNVIHEDREYISRCVQILSAVNIPVVIEAESVGLIHFTLIVSCVIISVEVFIWRPLQEIQSGAGSLS